MRARALSLAWVALAAAFLAAAAGAGCGDEYDEQTARIEGIGAGFDPNAFRHPIGMYTSERLRSPWDEPAAREAAALDAGIAAGGVPESFEVQQSLRLLEPYRHAEVLRAAVPLWAQAVSGWLSRGETDPEAAAVLERAAQSYARGDFRFEEGDVQVVELTAAVEVGAVAPGVGLVARGGGVPGAGRVEEGAVGPLGPRHPRKGRRHGRRDARAELQDARVERGERLGGRAGLAEVAPVVRQGMGEHAPADAPRHPPRLVLPPSRRPHPHELRAPSSTRARIVAGPPGGQAAAEKTGRRATPRASPLLVGFIARSSGRPPDELAPRSRRRYATHACGRVM